MNNCPLPPLFYMDKRIFGMSCRVQARLAAVAPQLGGLAASVVLSTFLISRSSSSKGGGGGGGSGGNGGDGPGNSGGEGPSNDGGQVGIQRCMHACAAPCKEGRPARNPDTLLQARRSHRPFHPAMQHRRLHAHAAAHAQAASAAEQERQRRKAAREAGKKLPTVSLTLVSFAVTRKAYERITQRFAREYEEATGQPVRFRLSFGGSGTQVTHSSPFLPPSPGPIGAPSLLPC